MIFRAIVFIFLGFFVMQSFAKYASHCSFHIEGIQESLHQAGQLKDTDIKVSNTDEQTKNDDEKDCDCPSHGSGCCLYNNFLISKTTQE